MHLVGDKLGYISEILFHNFLENVFAILKQVLKVS